MHAYWIIYYLWLWYCTLITRFFCCCHLSRYSVCSSSNSKCRDFDVTYKAREIMKTFSNLEDISLTRYDIWYTLDRIYDSIMVAVPSQLREIAQILIFQLEVVSLVKAHEFNSTLISSSGAQSVSWCKCSIVLPWCSGNVSISVMPPSHLTLKY